MSESDKPQHKDKRRLLEYILILLILAFVITLVLATVGAWLADIANEWLPRPLLPS